MRTIAFSLALVFLVGTATVAAAAVYDNPLVPDAELGEFRHGTYPSIGKRTHVGVDLVAACGTPVYAFEDGRVIDLVESEEDQNFNSLGYMVLIQHDDFEKEKPFATLYLHLQDKPLVNQNEVVEAGKKIGDVGNTGFSLGCHLHFEARHFLTRFHPAWKNIYGDGDQSSSEVFTTSWEDPEELFARFPHGISRSGEAEASGGIVNGRSSPMPANARNIDYFPLNPGRTNSFRYTRIGTANYLWHKEHPPQRGTSTARLHNAIFIDGKEMFPYQYETGYITYLMKDANGIGAYGKQSTNDIDPVIFDTPLYYIQYPISVGNSWESHSIPYLIRKKISPKKVLPEIAMKCEILGDDNIVTVPAGTFERCLRIKCSGSLNEKGFPSLWGADPSQYTTYVIEEINWYAPGVGFIKSITTNKIIVYYDSGRNRLSDQAYETLTYVLEKYSVLP